MRDKKKFKGGKIWIGDNPKLSAAVQEVLFLAGYKWFSSGREAHHTDKESLYFYGGSSLGYASKGNSVFFRAEMSTEYTFGDLADLLVPDVPKETVCIAGHVYNKEEFELAVKDLKSVKEEQ